MRRVRMTEAAQAALSVYVTDPVFDGEEINEAIRAAVDGCHLSIPDGVDSWEWALAIHAGANSADCDGDHRWASALTALASKVARA